MKNTPPSGLKIWVPLLFSVILILGMFIGFKLKDSLRNKRDIQAVVLRNDRVSDIIDLVKAKYVDTVSVNALYEDAINGILQHLDPHTTYISALELQRENEQLDGKFFGIGIEFNVINDTIIVMSVNEEGPAWKKGLAMGDQILKVGDSIVSGVQFDIENLMNMLKGEDQSQVLLSVKKRNSGRVQVVKVTRGVVPLASLEASFMLGQETGYIKLSRFSAGTYGEFKTALQDLKKKGMTSLILDLRDNPGGYLDAARDIVDELLTDGKTIVYTRGRLENKTEYKTKTPGSFEKGKVIVLINENSASASEIVAGAIQDWDRGVVVGRRSYGKGLVQQQYDLGDGAALRLTVARYYTPSGRSIQRPFDQGHEAYDQDYYDKLQLEIEGHDSLYQTGDTTRYTTENGRIVFGGGGINPDVHIHYDTSGTGTYFLEMVYSDELKLALWHYYTNHSADLKNYKTQEEFHENFHDETVILNKFLSNLKEDKQQKAKMALKRLPVLDNFKVQIKAQMARYLFRNNGYYFIQSGHDPAIKNAKSVLKTERYSAIVNR